MSIGSASLSTSGRLLTFFFLLRSNTASRDIRVAPIAVLIIATPTILFLGGMLGRQAVVLQNNVGLLDKADLQKVLDGVPLRDKCNRIQT